MRMKRKWPPFVLAAFTVLSFVACEDWGLQDPPAANQTFPKLEQVSLITFEEEEFDPASMNYYAYSGGEVAEVVEDNEERGNVLHLPNGYARIFNPLNNVQVQEAVSMTFWMKQAVLTDEEGNTLAPDLDGAIFSFQNSNGTQRMFITANGWLKYEGVDGQYEFNNPSVVKTGAQSTPGEWHYVALIVSNTGYTLYVDSEKRIEKTESNFDFSKIVQFMASTPYIYMGYGSDTNTSEMWLDDVAIYRNTITSKQFNRPVIAPTSDELPSPVFFLDFDGPVNAQIIGGGAYEKVSDTGFGKVFRNATGGMRKNYLLLPSDVLSHSATTKQMSISVWVNAKHAGESNSYMWSPLFTAYGAPPITTGGDPNVRPMFALQYRGVMQVNCPTDHWCDFTDGQNSKGANTLYHGSTDWLADHEWHHYMVTMTETTAKIYFDGEIANEWEIDGKTTGGQYLKGLFENGSLLSYICLGGNQAWGWGDPDPGFMFDDFAVYDVELPQKHIKKIIEEKTSNPIPVYMNNFEIGLNDTQIVGGGSLFKADELNYGNVFKNISGGMRKNYLLLPENSLSHSADSKEMSISVWVNASQAGEPGSYMWAPLFMAYGAAPAPANGTPMFALQYRGLAQVNCAGWCDFTDAQNLKGKNTLYHGDTDWLADGKWHLYTVTISASSTKIYFDGEIANEWSIDGTEAGGSINGLFTNGADLKYVCLGGNQAWSWGDNDPGFMFDDIAIYDFVLTPEQINYLKEHK